MKIKASSSSTAACARATWSSSSARHKLLLERNAPPTHLHTSASTALALCRCTGHERRPAARRLQRGSVPPEPQRGARASGVRRAREAPRGPQRPLRRRHAAGPARQPKYFGAGPQPGGHGHLLGESRPSPRISTQCSCFTHTCIPVGRSATPPLARSGPHRTAARGCPSPPTTATTPTCSCTCALQKQIQTLTTHAHMHH